MHGKKKNVYLLSLEERQVEAHLEDSRECPYCCTHLTDEELAPAIKRAEVMGYLDCDDKAGVR
jgi:hypothetical protein